MASRLSGTKVAWQIIVVFFVLTLGIGASGYFYYDYQRISIQRDKQQNLEAIADLKVRQITEWRKERLADARIIHRHGGRVSAEGRVGCGAVFSFSLPGPAGQKM